MDDPLLLTAAIAGAAVTFAIVVLLARWSARRRFRVLWRRARPWQAPTLTAWAGQGWLDPERLECLPTELSPSGVFLEWAWAHADSLAQVRLREPLQEATPFEAVVRDAWSNLPEALRTEALGRLRTAVGDGEAWWGGAEKGWNRRPLAIPTGELTQKEHTLPFLEMTDLTAAPDPPPINCRAMQESADGPDLILALTVLRHQRPSFTHPLAPQTGATHSLVAGLSTRIGADVGRRVGGSFGSVLGPIGSMVGQYLGEMAGTMGAKSLTRPSLPPAVEEVVRETETALQELGSLRETKAFESACQEPPQAILRFGQAIDVLREKRKRRVWDRMTQARGLLALEEVMWAALAELKVFRTASQVLLRVARKVNPVVAGGILLQNPWLVRSLAGGPELLTGARRTLNRAARVIRSSASQAARGTAAQARRM